MISKLLREVCMQFEVQGFSPIDEKMARALNSELEMVLRYSSHQNFQHNECLFNGVLIIGPRNFSFDRGLKK